MVQPWDLVAGPLVRRITALLEVAPGQDVVSIGGGEGRFAVWLAGRHRLTVEVVDPDPAAVARGEQAAAEMPRLLKEPVGSWLSSLIQSCGSPSSAPRRGQCTSGLMPSPKVTTFSSRSTGRSSR